MTRGFFLIICATLVVACQAESTVAVERPTPSAIVAVTAAPDDTSAEVTTLVVPTSSPATAAATPSDERQPEVGQGDEGQSEDEAREFDVLTGDYDMLLAGPLSGVERDGCVVLLFEARNVGKLADRYRIEVDNGELITGQPDDTLTVEVGESVEFEIELCDAAPPEVTVQAFSEGAGGELLGEQSVG